MFSPFGMGWMDFLLLVLDLLHLGSLLLTKSAACLGLSFLMFSQSRPGSALSVLDHVELEPFLSTRSMMHPGSACSILGIRNLESLMFALDFAHFESSLLTKSFARSGLTLFVFDFLHLELPLLPRSRS